MSESVTTGGTTRWAVSGLQMLPGLSPRPQHHICNKTKAVETVNSTSKALFVFTKDCQDTDIHVVDKVGKITAEECKELKIFVSDHVVGGTLELIKCKDTNIIFGPDAEV